MTVNALSSTRREFDEYVCACPACSFVRSENAEAAREADIKPADLHDKGYKAPLRDRTSAERKAEPIYSGVLKYFPDALAAISRVSTKSNIKHNGPDAPLHWSREKSSDQMDALVRHTLTPETPDAESGEIELAHAVWRGLAQLQLLEEKRNRERGVRSYSGI